MLSHNRFWKNVKQDGVICANIGYVSAECSVSTGPLCRLELLPLLKHSFIAQWEETHQETVQTILSLRARSSWPHSLQGIALLTTAVSGALKSRLGRSMLPSCSTVRWAMLAAPLTIRHITKSVPVKRAMPKPFKYALTLLLFHMILSLTSSTEVTTRLLVTHRAMTLVRSTAPLYSTMVPTRYRYNNIENTSGRRHKNGTDSLWRVANSNYC